jgi:signal transduction histidine kinase
VMIVPDSFKDPRFSNNPALTGEHNIHFYAGTPLITNEGQKIGTLCVLDHQPGDLDEQQQNMLRIIAKQAMKTIELKLKSIKLEESLKDIEGKQEFFNDASIRLRSFFESSTNFHVLLGKNGELIDFNKTAFKFVKNAHQTDMKRGDIFVKYIAPEFVGKFIDGYYIALGGDKHVEEGSTDYGPLGIIYWDATFEAAYDNENNIIGISYIIRDVTERYVRERKIMEQNDSLLTIAHMQAHEFRAPLTTIMGLMDLIKDDHYSLSPTYLQHLDQAVQNLDGKIRQIVSNINRVTA